MTLLTTEIHNHRDPERALVVFAADRRISRSDRKHDEREKILRVAELNAGIGYFGLAEVPQRGSPAPMIEWLRGFLDGVSDCKSLEELAVKLAEALNLAVPASLRREVVSGFHLAGFDSQGQVEFWYVRNVADDRRTILEQFEAREDFQRRDAPRLSTGRAQIYRNGDLRAHVMAWEELDKSLGSLLNFPDFKHWTTPEDYVNWVRFKMELIARFYEQFCTHSIIGRPVDAFAITRGC